MTTVITNKIGLDLVDIEVQQTGEAETDMFFQEPVLDASKDYVVGVSELTVPLSAEPMLTNNSTIINGVLLEFKRKQILGVMLVVGHPNVTIADNRARFKLKQHQVNTPADLLQSLNMFSNAFVTLQNLGVAAGAKISLEIMASPSGILSFRGNTQFWNQYLIQLGGDAQMQVYAQEVLGYQYHQIGIVFPAGGELSSDPAAFSTGVPDTYVASNHAGFVGEFDIRFEHSAFRYIENRLRIEVDADLSIPANILVENGQQKLHYNIASYALPQKFEARITTGSDWLVSNNIILSTHCYVGNTIIKAKNQPTTDWYTLLNTSNVQNMRLHIFVVRRAWNLQKKTWELTRNKLVMEEKGTWFLTLKFIQQF